jgi:hypothetical protein
VERRIKELFQRGIANHIERLVGDPDIQELQSLVLPFRVADPLHQHHVDVVQDALVLRFRGSQAQVQRPEPFSVPQRLLHAKQCLGKRVQRFRRACLSCLLKQGGNPRLRHGKKTTQCPRGYLELRMPWRANDSGAQFNDLLERLEIRWIGVVDQS